MNVGAEGSREGEQHFPAKAVISVNPVAGGWSVSSPHEEALMFLIGGHAEDQARTLGRCLASLGQTAVIEIRDQDGALADSVVYPANVRGGAS
jgi:hypothetical protein